MSYQVRAHETSDRGRLQEIWASSLVNLMGSAVLGDRYRWLYDRDERSHTFLGVHRESGSVIGCGTVIPCRLHLGGDGALTAGIMSDLAVVPQHRTAGPAVKILRAVAKGGADAGLGVLYGAPNPKSEPIFKRIRFELVGRMKTFVKPLRSEKKMKKHISSPPIAKAISRVVDGALRAYDWKQRLGDRRQYGEALTDVADERYDALWEQTPAPYITLAKTRQHLNWRYRDYPTGVYRFFELTDPDTPDELWGWVAYTVIDDAVAVGDLHCDFGRDIDLLLYAFSACMRRQGHRAICLSYVGSEALERALRAASFFPRDETPRPLFVRIGGEVDERQRRRLLLEPNWLVIEGDLDI